MDMLSPGDSPSSRPGDVSSGWGLEPGVLGGWGGGRLGLVRGGLGVGRALVRVPPSDGGEGSDWVVTELWKCPGVAMVA